MEDAAGFFANVFGGERFHEYVRSPLSGQRITLNSTQIGEISIMKDMTSVATTMMSDEEKQEIERAMNADTQKSTTPPVANTPHNAESKTTSGLSSPSATTPSATTPSSPTHATPHAPSAVYPEPQVSSSLVVASEIGSSISPPLSHAEKEKQKERQRELARQKAKIAQEQKEKLREQERERRKVMEARVTMLTQRMVERLRPFVDAKQPGGKDDPETIAFEKRMKQEADDLKLESFGVEEMEKAQAKGELGEEELRALEMDVTGKIMLASWRGARLEVVQVLREVVDNVLKEPGQPDVVLYNRAKALLLTGAIFKSTVPDESDEERRELERMVAEAAQPKSKKRATDAAKAKREDMIKQLEKEKLQETAPDIKTPPTSQ
ncbi:hypothetical protein C0992_011918 [Termitomyces sp. T32_za158]|nr:hypothetical protein C0992_011918 [Termitomyces sp. T32_za158]